jgi:arylsulfatase A-like enzyme
MARSLLFALCALAAFAVPLPAAEKPASQPNIIFIIADDLGWADVGFHGGKAPTPNLDRLAKESLELTHHYVYPVCSPTRAALLSGRYSTRFGVTTPQNKRAFPWDTVTLAGALKAAGYDTALCGKWHLGSKPEEGPQKFGFDFSYGSLAGGVGPWDHHYKKGEFTSTWHRNGTLVEEPGHVTDLIAREAVQWLESRTAKPFFLYVPFTAVHIPIREPEELVKRVPAEITEPSRREYAASVMHLDDAVGRILAALQKAGREKDTIVVFTSDNGGYPDARNDDPQYPADNYTAGPAGGDNRPLRGMKTTVYEGGIRVAAVVRWPGRLSPGQFAAPVHVSDWMPTFCALAGHTPERDPRWDGRNIWPWLSGAAAPEPRALYVAGPGFKSRTVQEAGWKLVLPTPGKKAAATGEDQAELFNLGEDPNEAKNLAPSMPEKVSALRAQLDRLSKADRDAEVKEGAAE